MVSFLEIALLAFTTLFPVANPLGMAAVFLSLTRQYPLAAKKILARKIAVYSFALLAVSLLLGTRVLEFFGISLAVIQIAGGLVVAATGWTLLNRREDDQAETHVSGTLEDALGHAFFPLTLPITVGPGCIFDRDYPWCSLEDPDGSRTASRYSTSFPRGPSLRGAPPGVRPSNAPSSKYASTTSAIPASRSSLNPRRVSTPSWPSRVTSAAR